MSTVLEDKVLDLIPMHRLFIDSYLKNNEDRKATAQDLQKSMTQINGYLQNPTICKGIAYLKNGLNSVPNTQLLKSEKDYKVEKSNQIKLLWDIAQTGAGLIYDREGNEILMNPASSIAAIRTISDLQGDFAPKEQIVTLDVKDERSVEEIQANVKMLMAEYNQLALNSGTTDGQVNRVINGPKKMALDNFDS